MGVTIAQQTWQFFSALLFGAALGVYYDLFRILRVAFQPGRVVAFVEDLFWWGSAGVLTVLFGIAGLGGQLRLFALLGEGIGFLLPPHHRGGGDALGPLAHRADLCPAAAALPADIGPGFSADWKIVAICRQLSAENGDFGEKKPPQTQIPLETG